MNWGGGSATEVDLAACLQDKVTCNQQEAMPPPVGAFVVFTSPAAEGWQPAVWGPIRGGAGSIGPAGAQDRAVLVYVGTPPLAGVRFLPPEGFFTVDDGTDVVNVESIAD